MNKTIIVLICLVIQVGAFGQFKKLANETIYKVQTKGFLLKKDSVIKILELPLIEIRSMKVDLAESYLNSKTDELRIKGKVCFGASDKCFGIPNMEMFSAARDSIGRLKKFDLIGRTQKHEQIDSSGGFQITVKIRKEESLMFYMKGFYVVEFRLGDLLVQNKSSCFD